VLRERLPNKFTVSVAGPFVLVSEEPPAAARERAAEIGRLASGLQRLLLVDQPRNVIDVWVFADTESYRDNTRTYLGDWPRTLGGYYSPRIHAVVVNLETGERTLAHEIVHPLLEARRLQRALARGRLPTLGALTVSTDREFYDDPRATNYLQARYLLHYLQERELLAPYYLAFRREHATDPTGYRTLQRVAGLEGNELQERWAAYVRELSIP
jgi:hypothetical protein